MPHVHQSGDVDDIQRQFKFTQKGHNWCQIMRLWLRQWNQSPMEASRTAKTEKYTSNLFNWILQHHHSAPAHTSMLVRDFLI